MRPTGGKARNATPENLVGSGFIIKRKVRGGRRASLSFLSRRHAPTITSFSRLSRGFSCLCVVKRGPQIAVFHVCRERVLVIITLQSSLGSLWVSCHRGFVVLGACLILLPPGSVAEQACLVLWLSKAAFLRNH